MEPSQDINTQFATAPQSERSGPWKLISAVAIVLVIGFAAGLVFFALQSSKNSDEVDELQASLNATTYRLNQFKEVTGVDNPEDFMAAAGTSLAVEEWGLTFQVPRVFSDLSYVISDNFLRFEGTLEAATGMTPEFKFDTTTDTINFISVIRQPKDSDIYTDCQAASCPKKIGSNSGYNFYLLAPQNYPFSISDDYALARIAAGYLLVTMALNPQID